LTVGEDRKRLLPVVLKNRFTGKKDKKGSKVDTEKTADVSVD